LAPSKKPPKVVETVSELLEILGFHGEGEALAGDEGALRRGKRAVLGAEIIG
jgi:hypothetical protein